MTVSVYGFTKAYYSRNPDVPGGDSHAKTETTVSRRQVWVEWLHLICVLGHLECLKKWMFTHLGQIQRTRTVSHGPTSNRIFRSANRLDLQCYLYCIRKVLVSLYHSINPWQVTSLVVSDFHYRLLRLVQDEHPVEIKAIDMQCQAGIEDDYSEHRR
jgi:hypothetical protein